MSLTLRVDKKGAGTSRSGTSRAQQSFVFRTKTKPADRRVLDFTGDAGQVPIPMALDIFLTPGRGMAFLTPWYASDRRSAAIARFWMTFT
jgi:hypothetical protein